jgi:hypothetical protein
MHAKTLSAWKIDSSFRSCIACSSIIRTIGWERGGGGGRSGVNEFSFAVPLRIT